MSCIVNIYFFLLNICISHKYICIYIPYCQIQFMCDISVKHKMHLWVTYYFYFTWLVHESQQVLLFTPLLVTHKPHYT